MQFFIVLVVILTIFPASSIAYDLKTLSKKCGPSVVLLKIFDKSNKNIGSGTGVSILKENWIITNYHVIEKAYTIKAVTQENASYKVLGVLAKNEDRDLAILKLEENNILPLELSLKDMAEPGERVVVIGGPLGLAGTLSEGIISAIRDYSEVRENSIDHPEFKFLQITAPISPGSSGSPVLNSDGKVIGIAVSHFLYGQNLNFAIPSTDVDKLIKEVKSEDELMSLQNENQSR